MNKQQARSVAWGELLNQLCADDVVDDAYNKYTEAEAAKIAAQARIIEQMIWRLAKRTGAQNG